MGYASKIMNNKFQVLTNIYVCTGYFIEFFYFFKCGYTCQIFASHLVVLNSRNAA